MHSEYIVKKANELIQECGERNPYYAAEQNGAILKYKDLGTLKGAYFGNMKVPVIVINSELDENTQKTVCAHELGHHILHKGQMLSCDTADLQSASILEREANIFASAFLIDAEKALGLLSVGNTIEQVSAIMGISKELLLFLLSTLKLTEAPDSTFLK